MAKNEDKAKDKLIDELLLIVEKKKAEIERIKNPVFKTNLSTSNPFMGDGGVRTNLNVASEETLTTLLFSFDFLIDRNKNLPESYGISGIHSWGGFKLEDWRDDILLKIKQKSAQNQIKDLREKEEKLNSLISERKKKENQLNSLKAELGL